MTKPHQNAPNSVTPLPSSLALIVTLGLVALLSGLLIVLVYEYTKPIIANNQRIATERGIFKVLPKTSSYLTFAVEQGALKLSSDHAKGVLIHAGYDRENNLVGVALHAAAQGYQDSIKLLYGYLPASGCISGFEVLKSTETPGFGAKITTDAAFLANFICLDARVNKEHNGLLNEIKTVRHGSKKNHWEIDAIAGATITSNAVGHMLNNSGHELHPIIASNLAQLKSAKTAPAINHEQPN